MNEIKCSGKTIQLDDEGFLVNPDDWGVDVAQALAAREEIGTMTDEQMEIV